VMYLGECEAGKGCSFSATRSGGGTFDGIPFVLGFGLENQKTGQY
jgi:hypothetical protein